MNKIKVSVFFLLLSSLCFAQKQTIRGKVVDEASGYPIVYASVAIANYKAMITATDEDGNFVIEKVPVGKVDVVVTSNGMKPVFLRGLDLLSGKELVVNVKMQDDVATIDEVVIKANNGAGNRPAINKQVLVGAAQVNIDQANRYAGSFNDIARMVTNMTGVRQVNDGNNDIVIRGNSPSGMLWRLDDVDIPNPNHFGSGGATGGAISMINPNLLANSDFLTAAFVPEYGNAVSGVFDLNLRKGSLYKTEFLGQLSFNGAELLAEGPIVKGKSSVAVNYRYSFLDFMSTLGIDFGTGTAIPRYQDATFNLYSTIGKKGQLRFFGMGGVSNIYFEKPEEKTDNSFTERETKTNAKTGVIGLQYRHQWSEKTFSRTTVAATYSSSRDELKTDDARHISFNGTRDFFEADYAERMFEGVTNIQTKIDKKNTLKVGGRAKQRRLTYLNRVVVRDDDNNPDYRKVSDLERNFYQAFAFASLNTKWTNNFQTTIGLSSQYFHVNKKFTFEPRISGRYQLTERAAFGLGYGFHSQIPNLLQFSFQRRNGTYFNDDLDYTKSHHFVANYTLKFPNFWSVKLEGYYQNIVNAPQAVLDDDDDYTKVYSSLNDDSFTQRSSTLRAPFALEDGAKGRNYGVELTIERTLNKGFYVLSTLSLFKSEYKVRDNKWRNTAFDGNIVYNLLAGKKWKMGKLGELSFDVKATYAGGNRFIAVDTEASEAQNRAVYKFDDAYNPQISAYFRPDIRIGFKINGRKVSQEWAVDIQNFINKKDNVFGRVYDEERNETQIRYQRGILPVMLYRIYF